MMNEVDNSGIEERFQSC